MLSAESGDGFTEGGAEQGALRRAEATSDTGREEVC